MKTLKSTGIGHLPLVHLHLLEPGGSTSHIHASGASTGGAHHFILFLHEVSGHLFPAANTPIVSEIDLLG